MDGGGNVKQATIYRMVMDKHICPYGLQAKDLLEREGFTVDDHWLRTPEETNAFKREHHVETTPQVFIGGERIGGYDKLQTHLGHPPPDPEATTYTPVLVVFAVAALMGLATSWAAYDALFTFRAVEWFIAFSMCILAILKLRDLSSFATMFLNYDLLTQRWVPYARVYPFAEAGAGILMISGALTIVSAPVALFIGAVGAWSVYRAVYIQKRELKCACVGGASNVPLGFVSLTENLMMIAMGLWMGVRALST
jgi:glutaredoxin